MHPGFSFFRISGSHLVKTPPAQAGASHCRQPETSEGHAVSNDLTHWKHLPIALQDQYGLMVFSGSAVVDKSNSSGFGTSDRPPMVAVYTGHNAGLQTQDIAFSNDRGRTWTRNENNPVLDIGEADFRNPKVFRHAPPVDRSCWFRSRIVSGQIYSLRSAWSLPTRKQE